MKTNYNNLRKTSTDNEEVEGSEKEENTSKIDIDRNNLSIDITDVIEADDGMNSHFTHYIKMYRNKILFSLIIIIVVVIVYVYIFKVKDSNGGNSTNINNGKNKQNENNTNANKNNIESDLSLTNSTVLNDKKNQSYQQNIDTNLNTENNSNNQDNLKENPYISILNSVIYETNDYKVYKRINRTSNDFTEGLFFSSDVNLIESTGMYRKSLLKEYSIFSPKENLWEISLDSKFFGEGVCQFRNYLIQLTYRENKVLIYKLNQLDKKYELLQTINKPDEIKEGWGITIGKIDQDDILFISDSTSSLKLFKITEENETLNFQFLKSLQIKKNNTLVHNVNELEFVKDKIIANIWLSKNIIIIDKITGEVLREIDFSDLVNYELNIHEKDSNIDVLNGIAYNENRNIFALTGKYWSGIYIVRIKDLL